MKHMEKMKKLLWVMVGLSVWGIAALFVATANISSEYLNRFLLMPFVLSAALVVLSVVLLRKSKGDAAFQKETMSGLLWLVLQTGYYGLMLTEVWMPEYRNWGGIFGFIGYFHVFIQAYGFSKKKNAVEFEGGLPGEEEG